MKEEHLFEKSFLKNMVSAVLFCVTAFFLLLFNATVQPMGNQSKNCTIMVQENRRIDGHCTRLNAAHVACVSANRQWMDPINLICLENKAKVISDQQISCYIQQKVTRDISGQCRSLGNIETCLSIDGGFMEPLSTDCTISQTKRKVIE